MAETDGIEIPISAPGADKAAADIERVAGSLDSTAKKSTGVAESMKKVAQATKEAAAEVNTYYGNLDKATNAKANAEIGERIRKEREYTAALKASAAARNAELLAGANRGIDPVVQARSNLISARMQGLDTIGSTKGRFGEAEASIKGVGEEAIRAAGSVSILGRSLGGLFTGAIISGLTTVGAVMTKAFATTSDQIRQANADLTAFLRNSQNAGSVLSSVRGISNNTLADQAGLAQNVRRAGQYNDSLSLGSLTRTLGLLQQGLEIGGAGRTETASVQSAVSEDAARGTISPRTLEAIRQNSQFLTDVLLNGTGRTFAQLAKEAADGNLSFSRFARALGSARDSIESNFQSLNRNTEQASNTITKSLERLAVAGVQASGLPEKFDRFATSIKSFVDRLVDENGRLNVSVGERTAGGALGGALAGGALGLVSPVPGGLLIGAAGGAALGAGIGSQRVQDSEFARGFDAVSQGINNSGEFARGFDGISEIGSAIRDWFLSTPKNPFKPEQGLMFGGSSSSGPIEITVSKVTPNAAAVLASTLAALSPAQAAAFESANAGLPEDGFGRINTRFASDPRSLAASNINVGEGVREAASSIYQPVVATIGVSNTLQSQIKDSQDRNADIAKEGFKTLNETFRTYGGGGRGGGGSGVQSLDGGVFSTRGDFGGSGGTFTIEKILEPSQRFSLQKQFFTDPSRIATQAAEIVANRELSRAVEQETAKFLAQQGYGPDGGPLVEAAANLNEAANTLKQAVNPMISAYGAGDYYTKSAAPLDGSTGIYSGSVARGGVVINFTVNANDANSFGKSRSQIEADLLAAVQAAAMRA